MRAKVLIEFKMNNITDRKALKDSNKTLEQIVRWLIKQEGLFGCVEDKFKIISVKEIRKPRKVTHD